MIILENGLSKAVLKAEIYIYICMKVNIIILVISRTKKWKLHQLEILM